LYLVYFIFRNSYTIIKCAVPENIHTAPWKVFVLQPLPPRNSSLASWYYFTSKMLPFKNPLPLGISDDLPRG